MTMATADGFYHVASRSRSNHLRLRARPRPAGDLIGCVCGVRIKLDSTFRQADARIRNDLANTAEAAILQMLKEPGTSPRDPPSHLRRYRQARVILLRSRQSRPPETRCAPPRPILLHDDPIEVNVRMLAHYRTASPDVDGLGDLIVDIGNRRWRYARASQPFRDILGATNRDPQFCKPLSSTAPASASRALSADSN
jgi:hypothetical protein